MEIRLGGLMKSIHLHTNYLGLPTYHQVVLHMPDRLSHRTMKDATRRYSNWGEPERAPHRRVCCGIFIGASLSEPHIDEFAVEFVYIYIYIILYIIYIYISYVVP